MKSRETSQSERYSCLLWLLQVIFVLCFIIVVIRLCLTPKQPIFMVADVHINPAFNHSRNSTLQHSGAASNVTSAVIILSLDFSNPNKRIGFIFEDFYVALYFTDTVIIGTSSLPGFYQEHRNGTSIVRDVQVSVEQQSLLGLITGRGFHMKVYLETKVRYKIFRSKTKHHLMGFEAYVPIGSDGRMLGEDIKLHLQPHSTMLNLTKNGN
ncbi:hypothetical protein SLA2020_481400 [Shorea laevis]